MDAEEIAVLKWLVEQRKALTITEIHKHFQTMNFSVLKRVLSSLEAQNKVEHGDPEGFKQTWQASRDRNFR